MSKVDKGETFEPALQELYAEGTPDDEVAVILRLSDPTALPVGVRIVAQFDFIATCRLRRGDIPRVRGADPVRSMKAARLYGPTPNDLAHSGAPDGTNDFAKDGSDGGNPGEAVLEPQPTDQRRPEGNLPTGKGCAVAHIDWRVDFAHPDFREADGKTRLLALWDQSSPADPQRPNRYGYGRIYETSDIDRALAAPDPYAALGYDPGPRSHGTHTLSISAGNGRSGGPTGLAPEADLIFVHLSTYTAEGPTLLGDSVALLEAFDFIARVAGPRPLVVNCSLGRHAGQHDGRTLTEQGVDAFLRATTGRACIWSTGNYFNRSIHAQGTLRPGESRILRLVTDVADRTPNEVDLWYPGVDRFQITLRGPGGAPEVRVGPGERSPVTVGGREAGRLYHRLGDSNNGDNQVTLFLYRAAPPGEWELILSGEDVADGRFHAWVERDAACKGCQARFARDDSDPTSTTGTICNGLRTLAVGAYDAHQQGHPLASFSSSGPTRDGRQKPDLVAPGVRVLAARSRPRRGGPDPPLLMRMSGTSMAAPHVTGTIALMFEAAGRPLLIEETRRLLLANVHPPADDVDPIDRLRLGSGYLNTAAAVAAAEQAGRPRGEPVVPMSRETSADSDQIIHSQRYEPMSAYGDETARPYVAKSDEATQPFEEESADADADEAYDPTPESSDEATGYEPDEYDAEARRDHRRDHRRQSGRVVPRSRAQLLVPLTGGPAALAVPVGGPVAFTVPLGAPATSPTPVPTGGPASPVPSAPQTSGPVSPRPSGAQTGGPTPSSPAASAPPEFPATEPAAPEPPVTEPLATEPPVTVASPDVPLYVPPELGDMGTKATGQPAELDEYDAETERDRKIAQKREKRDQTRARKREKRDQMRARKRDRMRSSRRVISPLPVQVPVPVTGGGAPPVTSPAPVQTGAPELPPPSAPQTDGPTPPSPAGSAPPEVPATEPAAPEPPVTEPFATEPPVTVASPYVPVDVPPAPGDMGTKAAEQPAQLEEYDTEGKRDARFSSSPRFQIQVPLTGGGGPALAVPFGGYGSPLAFTVPLGGTPPAVSPPSVQTGTSPEPAASEPFTLEPPVTVAVPDSPLYVSATEEEDVDREAMEQPEAWQELDIPAVPDFGEQVLATAETAAEASEGTAPSSAALLELLLGGRSDAESEGEGMAVPLSPLGHHGPAPSATALFNAFVYPNHPLRPRNALHRHYARRFEVLAYPGQPMPDLDPRPGDLLLRIARGEGWGQVAVVASRGLHQYDRLGTVGLRGEGYPRLRPGLYIQVVEVRPRRRRRADRFARRLSDGAGLVLPDTLLLRPRFPGWSFREAEAGFADRAGCPLAEDVGFAEQPAPWPIPVAPTVESAETFEEAISVDDVASEMNGLRCRFLSDHRATRADGSARGFSAGALLPIDDWNGTGAEATVAGFSVPKIVLAPAPESVSGMRRHDVALDAQRTAVVRNARELADWVAREGEYRRNHRTWEREKARLETLLARRQATYSRMWVRQMMYNRFDVAIAFWVRHYNTQLSPATALDPNVVKSMLYQESRMGTSGEHLMPPPSDWSSSDRHPIRSRYNIGQAIDSWGPQQWLMMREMATAIFTRNGLNAFERTWLSMSNSDYAAHAPFLRALREFFEFRDGSNRNLMGTTGRDLHEDYGFWIRAAIRWLFVKYANLRSPTWAEAVRAYNGGGARARAYRDAVMARVGSTDPYAAESLDLGPNEVFEEDGMAVVQASFQEGEPRLDTSATLTWEDLSRVTDSRGQQQVFYVVTGAPASVARIGDEGKAIFHLRVRNTNSVYNHKDVATKYRVLDVLPNRQFREVMPWRSFRGPDLEDESSRVIKLSLGSQTLLSAYNPDSPLTRLEVEYHWRETWEDAQQHYNRTGLDFVLVVAPIEYLLGSKQRLTTRDIELNDPARHKADYWIPVGGVDFTADIRQPVTIQLDVTSSVSSSATGQQTATSGQTRSTTQSSTVSNTFNVQLSGELSRGGSAKATIEVLELGVQQMFKLGASLGYSRTRTDTSSTTVAREFSRSLMLSRTYATSQAVTTRTTLTISPPEVPQPRGTGGRSEPRVRSVGIGSVGVYLYPLVAFFEVPYVRFDSVNAMGQATRRSEGQVAVPFVTEWRLTSHRGG